jgi:hypothetical protein
MVVSGKSFIATDRETLHTAVLRALVWYGAMRIVSTQKIVYRVTSPSVPIPGIVTQVFRRRTLVTILEPLTRNGVKGICDG